MNLQTGETGMMDQTGTMGFIIGVPMMRKYLDREYGDAERFDPNLTSAREGTNDRKGIMAFGNRHCDLWLGQNIHRPLMYNNQIWIHKSVVDNGLFFWEVPYSEVLGFYTFPGSGMLSRPLPKRGIGVIILIGGWCVKSVLGVSKSYLYGLAS